MSDTRVATRPYIIGPSRTDFVVPATTVDFIWDFPFNPNFASSNGGRTATQTPGPADNAIRGIHSASSGKFYWEVVVNAADILTGCLYGICNASMTTGGGMVNDNNGGGVIGGLSGQFVTNAAAPYAVAGGTSPFVGDRVGIALDVDGQLIWMRINGGTWGGGDPALGTGGGTIANIAAGGALYPSFNTESASDQTTGNFASSSWVDAAPAGFVQWT